MDKLYRCILRFGTARVLLVVVVIAVLLAQIVLTLLRWILHAPADSFVRDTLIATAIPMIVASVISSVTIRLAIRLDQTLAYVSELAVTDSLTGIYNRRYFMDRAEDEFKKCVRYGLAVSVLMLDVDYFKRINDRYGHACGDEVLKTMARTCKNALRSVDVLARYGGEEFVVLLPLSDSGTAALVAERIRAAVAELQMHCAGEDAFRVTVSIGLASRSGAMSSIGDLLNLADMAMYRAKEGGRNQVRHSDEMPGLVA